MLTSVLVTIYYRNTFLDAAQSGVYKSSEVKMKYRERLEEIKTM